MREVRHGGVYKLHPIDSFFPSVIFFFALFSDSLNLLRLWSMSSSSPSAPFEYLPQPRSVRPSTNIFNPVLLLADLLGLPVLLGLGAMLQLACSAIGAGNILPVLLLGVPTVRNLLSYFRVIENGYLKDSIPGRTEGSLPQSFADGVPNEEMAVLQLGTRSNSGLGLLDPASRIIGAHFARMMEYLESNAHEAGYLGCENYLGLARPSQNTLLIIFYFKSYEDIHRFAHGFHMAGWRAYMAINEAAARPVAIWHEAYVVSKSESIYVNTEPVGMGKLWAKDEGHKSEDGSVRWINGLHSLKGKSTSKGRLGQA